MRIDRKKQTTRDKSKILSNLFNEKVWVLMENLTIQLGLNGLIYFNYIKDKTLNSCLYGKRFYCEYNWLSTLFEEQLLQIYNIIKHITFLCTIVHKIASNLCF